MSVTPWSFLTVVTLWAMTVPAAIACAGRHLPVQHHHDYDGCFARARAGASDGFSCVDDGQIAGATFSGHVVFQAANGSLQPVTDAEFWRGTGDQHPDAGTLERVDISVGSDGWFSYTQLVHYSQSLQKKGGRFIVGDTIERFVFVVRAPGCLEVTVPFRTDDPDHLIIMSCEQNRSG